MHSIWHSIWHSILTCYLTFILTLYIYIYILYSDIFSLAWHLAFYLAFYLTFYLAYLAFFLSFDLALSPAYTVFWHFTCQPYWHFWHSDNTWLFYIVLPSGKVTELRNITIFNSYSYVKNDRAGQPVNVRSVRSVEAQAQPNDYSTHDGSMVLLYMVCHGSHQYTPFMLVYIPAPWIRHGVDDHRFFCHQKSRKSHLVSNRITYLMTSAIYSAIVRPKLPGRGPYVPMFGTWFRAVAVAVVVGPLRPCLAEDDCLECEMKMLQLDAKVSEWKNGPTVGRNTVCGYTRYVTYCINYIYIHIFKSNMWLFYMYSD